MGELTIFYTLAGLIATCSVMVIIGKNPVASAVFLVVDLFLVAGIYALLGADFIAAIQVLIYAGAIMVLFLFVIMLINLNPNSERKFNLSGPEVAVMGISALGFIIIAAKIAGGYSPEGQEPLTREGIDLAGGHTLSIAVELFTKYVWPFELTSMLILLAVIGSVVVAKKDKKLKET